MTGARLILVVVVLEICGSSLLLGHVFAPNLCITLGIRVDPGGGGGGGAGGGKQGMVGNVILPNMTIVFYSHANKTHSHMNVFYTLPRFKREDFGTWK